MLPWSSSLVALLGLSSLLTEARSESAANPPKERRLVDNNLPGLTTFEFTTAQEQMLTGIAATECAHAAGTNLPSTAIVGDLALMTMKDLQGSFTDYCFTDGRYNNRDYKVEQGILSGSDGSTRTAYRVHPPITIASQWVVAPTMAYFRTAQAGTFHVHTFDGTGFTKIGSQGTSAGVFAATGVRVDNIPSPLIVVFDATGNPMSSWPRASPTVEAAWLAGASGFSISARRFQITGHPFVPETDWNVGPNDHYANYGIPKKFFPVDRSDGREGVVWQDQTTHAVHMTWFAADLLSSETATIVTGRDHLVAAASDGSSHIVLILVGETAPANKAQPTTATAIKASSSSGNVLITKSLDTSANGLNIHAFSASGASLAWNAITNKIGLIIARLMTQGRDGLNHQGAIAILLDGSTLNVLRNYGQTSGHSFANSLRLASDGSFLGMDLGDNYPRGVHVWSFDDTRMLGKFVVYTFKTKHATTSAGRPAYPEISNSETTYYKWSNDNNVYTELAHDGLVETSDGILVFFAGERPSLDNSQVGSVMNQPRNLGFVKIGKNIAANTVLSSGGTENGGFYNFGGGWSSQQNTGINFLTSFTSTDECVSRLKTARLAPGTNLVFMEIWTKTSYVRTEAVVVDDNGAVVSHAPASAYPVRLPIADDLRVVDGRAVAYAGTSAGQIVRYEVCAGSFCPAAGGGGSPATTTAVPETTTVALATTTVAPVTTTAAPAATTAAPATTSIAAATTAATVTTSRAGDCGGSDACRDTITSINVNGATYTDCQSLIAGTTWFGMKIWCQFYESANKICQLSCGACSASDGPDCSTTATSTPPAATTTTPASTAPPTTATLSATSVAASTTTRETTIGTTSPAAGGNAIASGDVIFLRTRGGSGSYVDIEGAAVRARWPQQGNWQAIVIEKNGGGGLSSGDRVFLTAHTGALIDVEGQGVQARWSDKGDWQTFTIEKPGGGTIASGDSVCFKAHTGKHVGHIFTDDVSLEARWNDCGDLQRMRIEKEDVLAIFSGDAVHFLAHTGKHMDVGLDNTQVFARWEDRGAWQTFVITSIGGRSIMPGDSVFLKAHTGNQIDVQDSSVQARWSDQGDWQRFVVEKNGVGAVRPGDTIFLKAHTGNYIDVEAQKAQARWAERGSWQSFTIEKRSARVLRESVAETSEFDSIDIGVALGTLIGAAVGVLAIAVMAVITLRKRSLAAIHHSDKVFPRNQDDD